MTEADDDRSLDSGDAIENDRVPVKLRQHVWEVAHPLLILFGVGVLGLVFYTLVVGMTRVDVASWVPTFLTSSGFAGLAALLAAAIGAVTIGRQLSQSKRVQADATWWKAFEWVTERALPLDSKNERLPYDISISSLTPLRDTATTTAQAVACDGLLNHLLDLQQSSGASQMAKDSGAITEDNRQVIRALEAYLTASRNDTAGSLSAEAHLYELSVLQALFEVPDLEFISAGSSQPRPDALVRVPGGRTVAIDCKFGKQAPTNLLAGRLRSTARSLVKRYAESVQGDTSVAVLIVTPVDFGQLETGGNWPSDISIQRWSGSEDTVALADRIRELSSAS